MAVVGVGAGVPKPKPAGWAGWVNGFGLGAVELVVDTGAPKDVLAAIGGAPKANEVVEGVAGELKGNALLLGAAVVSAAFWPNPNVPVVGTTLASEAF